MPFVKGKSGNPTGRPKGSRGISAYIRSKTKDFKALVDEMMQIAFGERKAGNGVVVRAEDADKIRAIQWLADRGLGKVVETQELNHIGLPQPPALPDVAWKRAQ